MHPSISKIMVHIYREHVQRLAPTPGPKLGSVPLRGHRIPWGNSVIKGFFSLQGTILTDFRFHCIEYTPTIPLVKRKERKYIVPVKALGAQWRTRAS